MKGREREREKEKEKDHDEGGEGEGGKSDWKEGRERNEKDGGGGV